MKRHYCQIGKHHYNCKRLVVGRCPFPRKYPCVEHGIFQRDEDKDLRKNRVGSSQTRNPVLKME